MSSAALVASIIFILMFVGIALRIFHETSTALLGAVAVFLVTYIGGRFNPNLIILTFEEAMDFVDWNVVFLIMGMMIFMAILSETNVFRWLGFHLYRWAGGNVWLIAASLILLTGLTSAFLNNVTAILLLVPMSIQLAIILEIDPLAIVIAEILAANIGGAATLIGDPPSTIVGSHIGLSFSDYLVNMLPVVVLCMLILLVMNRIQYRQVYTMGSKPVSGALLAKLASESQIEDRATLCKSLLVGSITLALFITAEYFSEMPPSVVALSGATVLIVWVRPDLHRMLREVDWTTLLFFIGVFIVVGAMEHSGAIEWVALRIQTLAGSSLARATLLTTWIAGIVSGIVDNIPFTVAALPVTDFLTHTIPGAGENNILYWALILGADLGGNLTFLGSAPNIVALGLLAAAGYRLSFWRFMRDGVPVTIITLGIASVWLLVFYL